MKNEELISLYIDDELSLTQKKAFVGCVHENPSYVAEVHEFIDQELMLHAGDTLPLPKNFEVPQQTHSIPSVASVQKKKLLDHPFVRYGSGWVAAAGIFLFLFAHYRPMPLQTTPTLASDIATIRYQPDAPAPLREYRFLLYEPQAQEVSVVGSFNNWQPIPLSALGTSGYWELHLPLPAGEYAYTFQIDGVLSLPDPTVPYVQPDGFGGVNSILVVGDML
ncbi:glycogen-binding domain-containing protein [Chrysiogenes arsenatis]|uniref:glycogen-binding domain-containing protein n=1 Tax=Chrysiogenes arsenatis TaxID=309797 RepID=UPI00040248F5|nr:glycogen-binding domain-containing protein [Chrysiogenes arsenatis]